MFEWMTRTTPALLLAIGLSASASAAPQVASNATPPPTTTCCKNGASQAACCKTGAAGDDKAQALGAQVIDLQNTVKALQAQQASAPRYFDDPLADPLLP